MLNRSEVFRTAWASYRQTAAEIGLTRFSRRHFSVALLQAWADAKWAADYEAQQAEEAAEAAANPAKASARRELLDLQMKDRWNAVDRARAVDLHHVLAA